MIFQCSLITIQTNKCILKSTLYKKMPECSVNINRALQIMPIYYILYCILHVPEQPKCPKWNLGWTHKSSTHTYTHVCINLPITLTYGIFGEAVWLLVNHISIQLYLIQPRWWIHGFIRRGICQNIRSTYDSIDVSISLMCDTTTSQTLEQLESKIWPRSGRCNENGLTPTVICLDLETVQMCGFEPMQSVAVFFFVYHDIFHQEQIYA